jgi:predicted deacetylase
VLGSSVPGQKSLIVSLHDAHPGSHAAIAEQIAFLAGYGIARSSILVVPEFHHGGSVTESGAFCDDVSRWQDAGHELVLHGYYHDRRDSPPERLSQLFWTRLYTSREAEFLDLPLDTAKTRLEAGRALFASLGWRTTGFLAPAWLIGKLRETELIRLSLHPRDLEFPLIRRQVDQILRASLKRGFQATTYGEYVAR